MYLSARSLDLIIKMARKKKSRISKTRKTSRKELLSSPSSYRSLLFGAITVVVLFLIGVSVFQFLQSRKGDINGDGVSTEEIDEALKDAASYTVKPSDTLWSIAESELGSGFEWPKIADVNNIKTPEELEKGMKLTIPTKAAPTTEAASATPEPTKKDAVNNETYVIKRGDTLWSIAESVYKDGYKWVDLARVNNLDNNPDLIHADNKLIIPR